MSFNKPVAAAVLALSSVFATGCATNGQSSVTRGEGQQIGVLAGAAAGAVAGRSLDKNKGWGGLGVVLGALAGAAAGGAVANTVTGDNPDCRAKQTIQSSERGVGGVFGPSNDRRDTKIVCDSAVVRSVPRTYPGMQGPTGR